MTGRPRGASIRAHLLVGFVGMALLPAMAIALGSIVVGYFTGRQQALDQLASVAALQELEIRSWIQEMQGELTVAANEEYGLERVHVVLDLARDNKYLSSYNKVTRNWLGRLVTHTRHYDELFLLDLEGRVALSTDPAHEGESHSQADYFKRGLEGPTVQPEFCVGPTVEPSAIVALPIRYQDGELLGVLAGREGSAGGVGRAIQRFSSGWLLAISGCSSDDDSFYPADRIAPRGARDSAQRDTCFFSGPADLVLPGGASRVTRSTAQRSAG